MISFSDDFYVNVVVLRNDTECNVPTHPGESCKLTNPHLNFDPELIQSNRLKEITITIVKISPYKRYFGELSIGIH